MKKPYFLFFLLSCFCGFSQIVSIPDANFKAKLIEIGIDTNNNGEIEVTEATGYGGAIDVSASDIHSLEGILSFTHITALYCNDNALTELNLTNWGNVDIVDLDFAHNQITEIDLTGLDLLYLNVSYNQLTQLEIPNATVAEYYDISGNAYTTVSLSADMLYAIECSDTQLTSLDLSGVQELVYIMEISNNPELKYINFKNGYNEGFGFICQGEPLWCLQEYAIYDNPSLTSICLDADDLNGFQTYFANQGTTVNLSTDCLLATPIPVSQSDFIVYPNPVQKTLQIEMPNNTRLQSVNIFNTLGQLVLTVSQSDLTTIDVSALKSGTYFIEGVSEPGKSTQKFIKI